VNGEVTGRFKRKKEQQRDITPCPVNVPSTNETLKGTLKSTIKNSHIMGNTKPDHYGVCKGFG
jgi:hypothetical protein